MVTLTDLPEEVIIMIIKSLDLYTLHSLYNTCKRTRNIVKMRGIIKTYNVSLSPMATAHSLKINFFKDIAGNLQELNMCGVCDLTLSALLAPMRKLKCLTTLDLSYTNVNISDFVKLYQICPTIKNLTINFVFGKLGLTEISHRTFYQTRNIFKRLDNVHFVGSLSNLMYYNLVVRLIDKAKLNTLTFTVAECDYMCITSGAPDQNTNDYEMNFNRFNIFLMNWKELETYYQNISTLPIMARINPSSYEFIVLQIKSVDKYKVLISPLFKDFFYKNFGIVGDCVTDFYKPLFGNTSIMLWPKNIHTYDDAFFENLFNEIKVFFPKVCSSSKSKAPQEYDCFYIIPENKNLYDKSIRTNETESRKRRRSPPNLVLNYDDLFREKRSVKIGFIFHESIRNCIALSSDCNYLEKVTFVSLTGKIRYKSDFFNILMSCCNNLYTLNVEAPSLFPCAKLLSKALPSNTSLKNLRLVDKRIDFKVLFRSFSKCLSLENICVIEDTVTDPVDLADPSIMIAKCYKLYNCYIEAPLTVYARNKKIQIINNAKIKYKRFPLNIVLHVRSTNNKLRYIYDPFIALFHLNPLKPL